MFLLILGGVGYVIYTLNLAGPMLRVSNAMSTQAVEIAREKLREFVNTDGAAGKGRAKVGVEVAADDVDMVSLDKKGRRMVEDGKKTEEEGEDW